MRCALSDHPGAQFLGVEKGVSSASGRDACGLTGRGDDAERMGLYEMFC